MTAPIDQTVTDAPPNGLSRRSVVRVGAAAAWSVPVVALATSAPALAASGDVLAIVFDPEVQPVSWSQPKWTFKMQVQNQSSGTEASTQQVALSLPQGTNRLFYTPVISAADTTAGWTGSGPTSPLSGPWEYVFTRAIALPPGEQTPLVFQLQVYWAPNWNPSAPRVGTLNPSTPEFGSVSAQVQVS